MTKLFDQDADKPQPNPNIGKCIYVMIVEIATELLDGDTSIKNAARYVNGNFAQPIQVRPLSEILAC